MLVEIQKIKTTTTLTMFQIDMRSLSNIRIGVLSVYILTKILFTVCHVLQFDLRLNSKVTNYFNSQNKF